MNLFLDYLSLAILVVVILIFIYGLILIHDIPYEIAVNRNHPHQDAIHVAGWISLFFLHSLWPILWIWAMLYDPIKKQWSGQRDLSSSDDLSVRVKKLEEQINKIGNEG